MINSKLDIVAMFATIFGLLVAIIPFAQAQSNSPRVFPLDSKPYGLTYADWTVKWWQWELSISKDNSPANDDTGKNCAQKQEDPNVWFLLGTPGGSATRKCLIPAGKAILFPILNVECSYVEFPTLKTESQLRACAKADQDKVRSLEATVDGVKLQNLEKYRVQSPLFSIRLPENNVLGLSSGNTQVVSDGFWIMLKPLSAGNHEIHFSGSLGEITTTSPLNFATEVLYHLTVR
jgi:hypothetical protein